MSPPTLLQRQAGLLAFLTSGRAIFGDGTPYDPALCGFDHALLRLEARISYEKRMEKVQRTLPRTFALLGPAEDCILRAFAESCPPESAIGLDNAKQFCAFLRARSASTLLIAPHVPDIAACELAMALVRNRAEAALPAPHGARDRRPVIRRHPGTVLLRCAYDIRKVFEDGAGMEVSRRDTRLAVALPAGADRPQVFEVKPPVFQLLVVLDRWTDPFAIGLSPALDGFLAELSENGLLDVRR